jgi:hypothetical protein
LPCLSVKYGNVACATVPQPSPLARQERNRYL